MSIVLEGSHGTCKSFLPSIHANGMRTGIGLKGQGAYFWNKSRFYLKFAKSWYQQQFDNNRMPRGLGSGCAILIGKIECDPSSFLDLHDPELRESLGELVDKYVKASTVTKEISAGYDKAIQSFEKAKGHKIMVLFAPVTPPENKYTEYYNSRSQGHPPCIIVRDCSVIKDLVPLDEEKVIKL